MFQICTITNNLTQYAEMKTSLVEAGFTEDKCCYEVFDNSAENRYDPYRTISRVLAETAEPYVIFCHQDILLDRGDGFGQLVSQLDNLSHLDPHWAIAGNAGAMEDLTFVIRITDPYGVYHQGELPQKVCSLDENFFVINVASGLRCSEALNGFHLYATDLCLQAMQHDLSAYVIDFHLTHLSPGNTESAGFKHGLAQFCRHWNQFFLLCIIHTPCTSFTLSRSRVMRRLLYSARISGWIKRHMGAYMRLSRAKKRVRQSYQRLQRSAQPTLTQP